MPSSVIDVRTNHAPDVELGLIDAVHDALIAAFTIPATDKHVRLIVHEPTRFAVPCTLASPDLYTLVTIDCFAGRTVEAKRCLYGEIVNRLTGMGIPADHVTVIVRDIDTENWGIRGGQAACDVDLGFDVNV